MQVRRGPCPSVQDHRAWTIWTCYSPCWLSAAASPTPAARDRRETLMAARPRLGEAVVRAASRTAHARRVPGSAEASLAEASHGLLRRSTIRMNCSDVANENALPGDAQLARGDMTVIGNSRANRVVVVDRNIVGRTAQNAPMAGKAAADELAGAADAAADGVAVVDAVADIAVVVSQLAEMLSDRKVSLRFAKMGRARVVVVVSDPLSR